MRNYFYRSCISHRDAVPFVPSALPPRHSLELLALQMAPVGIGKRLWLSVAAVGGRRRRDAVQRSIFGPRTVAVASEAQLLTNESNIKITQNQNRMQKNLTELKSLQKILFY